MRFAERLELNASMFKRILSGGIDFGTNSGVDPPQNRPEF
jgi:hypothetical protein